MPSRNAAARQGEGAAPAPVVTQGIKFYDPEIVGDTPETVEWRGIANLVAELRDSLGLAAGKPVFVAGGSVRPPTPNWQTSLIWPHYHGTCTQSACVILYCLQHLTEDHKSALCMCCTGMRSLQLHNKHFSSSKADFVCTPQYRADRY